MHWGRMVTGETFITDEGRQKINDKFAPFTVDMETASIAHVYNVNRIPFISIRCITDTDACRGMCKSQVKAISKICGKPFGRRLGHPGTVGSATTAKRLEYGYSFGKCLSALLL